MIDFNNGKNSGRFDPSVYIKTKSGSILAIIKLLEAIAACIGLIGLFIGFAGITAITDKITEAVYEISNSFLPVLTTRLAGNLARFSFLLPMIILALIILDGLGTFMMRYAGTGEGIVRFVHFICWVRYIIEIIFFIIGIIWHLYSLRQLNNTAGGSSTLFVSLGMLGIFVYPVLAAAFAYLLFLCGYHHDICTVLKTVQEEKRTGYNVAAGDNHLPGRSSWLAWGSGIAFVNSAMLFIYPLVTNKQFVDVDTSKMGLDLGSTVLLGSHFVLWLLIFLKYLSLRICAGNFRKYHEPQKQKKSSSCLLVILVILLCLGAYAFGKNKGISEILNKNSRGSSYSDRTSATAAAPGPTKVFNTSGGAELERFSEAADRYDSEQSEMSAADVAYFTAAMHRINQKLLSVY